MLNLDQLRIFVAVAEREHLTQAAEALHLTPSAVSSAIRNLEERHGVALFHRVGRRIELTDAGRIFQREARAVLDRAGAAELALAELGDLRRGSVRLMASQTIASYWLPPLLVAFHEHHPGIALDLVIGNTRGVAAAVLDGRAELGFIEGRIDEPALAMRRVAADHLCAVTTPDHALARTATVSAAGLAAARWILREPGSGTRSAFEDALRARKVDPAGLDIVLELPSNEAVRAAVRCGGFATVLSELVVADELAAGRLVRIALDLPPRDFSMLVHKERYRSRSVQALEALITAR